MNPAYLLADVLAWLDRTLDPTRCDDYGPNGLQVDAGDTSIRRVATGVSANLAFIEAASRFGADLLVVHHGIYWHGSPSTATGALGRRIRAMLAAKMALAAYHLPLDGHPTLGNAFNLARALGLVDLEPSFASRGTSVGCSARFPRPMTIESVGALLNQHVGPTRLFPGGPPLIDTVGIVTGGAPRQATEAAARGLHLYITGEATEHTQATAFEEQIHIAAAGHHRTETFGPRALAAALAEAFPGLESVFIDVDNPS